MKRTTLWRLPRGRLLLASTSPRRRDLLAGQGLRFSVADPGVDEDGRREPPATLARRLAMAKARAAALRHPRAWCVGADTIVVLGSAVLGKPRDAGEARRMLRALSGRTHRVLTAVAVVGPGFARARVVSTRVRFRRLSAEEIRSYVAGGESFDKAGAYGAQGEGALLLAGIEGDWSNVVGLPLGALRGLLAAAAAGQGDPAKADRIA